MIKWLNREVIPATYRDLSEAAKEYGRTRVYSVDRRTGRAVIEVMGGRQVQPMFDGSLEARQKLIREIRARRSTGLGGARRGEAWHGEARQGWGLVELICKYLARQGKAK